MDKIVKEKVLAKKYKYENNMNNNISKIFDHSRNNTNLEPISIKEASGLTTFR